MKEFMMNHFPMLSRESVNLCEADYLKITGLESKTLTEISGFACAKEILAHCGPLDNDHVVIYAGPGKKGAHGVSIGLYLAGYSKKVTIVQPIQPEYELDTNNKNRAKAFYSNIEFTDKPTAGDIFIDALFGSGVNKKPDGVFEHFIKVLNEQSNTIISIDTPSGIDANTSVSIRDFVKPDLTLAIGCLKPVHKHPRAEGICGKIIWVDLGLPHKFIEKYAEIEKVAC